MQRRLAEIAAAVGGTLEGDPDRRLTGVAPLDTAGPDELSFLSNRRYLAQARLTRAGAVIASPGDDLPGRDLIRVPSPYLALAQALALFVPPPPPPRGLDPTAVLGEGVRIGADPEIGPGAVVGARVVLGDRVRIMAQAVIGEGAEIGDDTVIHPLVCLYPGVRIGRRVVIHAGAVIGADGFGFVPGGEVPVKIPQLGTVVIEDDVEIGSHTCIDRATLGETRIGRGARIDNLVQVAHNAQVGAGSLLAAQSGISGSTRLGRGVIMAGQSGAVGHITLGDGARVAAKSAVTKDVPPGVTVAGVPAVEIARWRRAAAVFTRVPEALRRLAALERASGGPGGEASGKGRRER